MWYSAHMDTIVYVIGPTGVGKTSLATTLAKTFKGNLISADSIQVYKGLDIISGKDLDEGSSFNTASILDTLSIGTHLINGTPTWCLDIVDPWYSFHVGDFHKAVTFVIERLRIEHILPIVVGGSTLYVNALLNPIASINIKSDNQFRTEMEQKSINDVLDYLKRISFEAFHNLNESERGNKRRIIRKIEILKHEIHKTKPPQSIKQSPIIIGLHAAREYLKKNIDKRVETRIGSGAFEEAELLYGRYEKLSPQIQNANGYKQLFKYFNKEYSREEAIQRWKFSEYRHAKNQMTYFKKYVSAEWFDVEGKYFQKEVLNFILNKHGLSK